MSLSVCHTIWRRIHINEPVCLSHNMAVDAHYEPVCLSHNMAVDTQYGVVKVSVIQSWDTFSPGDPANQINSARSKRFV